LHVIVPDAAAKPAAVATTFHNTTGQAITVTSAGLTGSNITQGASWVLPRTAKQRHEVDYSLSPFTDLPGWSSRKRLGSVKVEKGKWAAVVVTFSFLGDSIAGAEFVGLTVNCETASGATGMVSSYSSATYSAEC
jgi:hypothetical protein